MLRLSLLPIALAGCASGDDSPGINYANEHGLAIQPFPANYRAEVPAFMKTYLNNPVGVRDALMSEPIQRAVVGRQRYVSCLHFSPREADGTYRGTRETAVLFVDGRLDRMIENPGELCAAAAYQPFPELEKLTR